MVTFNEFMKNNIVQESDQESYDSSSMYLLTLNIENIEALYQKAMRAKNAEDLKKVMLAMKSKFPDAKDIQFNKISWDNVYKDINEKSIDESDFTDNVNKINSIIDKATTKKDKKVLDELIKDLEKILDKIKDK